MAEDSSQIVLSAADRFIVEESVDELSASKFVKRAVLEIGKSLPYSLMNDMKIAVVRRLLSQSAKKMGDDINTFKETPDLPKISELKYLYTSSYSIPDSKISPEWESRYGSVVWARGISKDPWWPSYVCDPRLINPDSLGGLRKDAFNNIGKKYLVYYYGAGIHKHGFVLPTKSQMMDYFENRVEFESQALAKGKNSLDKALPLADSEAIRDAKLRVEWAQLLHEINEASKPQIKKSSAQSRGSDPDLANRKRGRPRLHQRQDTDESNSDDDNDANGSGNDEIDFSSLEDIRLKSKKRKDSAQESNGEQIGGDRQKKKSIINEQSDALVGKRGRPSISANDSSLKKEGSGGKAVEEEDGHDQPRKVGRRLSKNYETGSKVDNKVAISVEIIESSDDSDGNSNDKNVKQNTRISGGRSSSRFTEIAARKQHPQDGLKSKNDSVKVTNNEMSKRKKDRLLSRSSSAPKGDSSSDVDEGSVESDSKKKVKQSGRLQRSKAVASSESSSNSSDEDDGDEDEDKSATDEDEKKEKKTSGRLISKTSPIKDTNASKSEKGRKGRPAAKDKEHADSVGGKLAEIVPPRRNAKRSNDKDADSRKLSRLDNKKDQGNSDDAADEGGDEEDEGEKEQEEEVEVTKTAVPVKAPITETPFERLSRLLRLLVQYTKDGAVLLDKAFITFDKIESLSPTTAELKDSGAADRINILRKHPVTAIANRAKQLRTKWINSATKAPGAASPALKSQEGSSVALTVTASAPGRLPSADLNSEVDKPAAVQDQPIECATPLVSIPDTAVTVTIAEDLDRLRLRSEPESESVQETAADVSESEPMVDVAFDPGNFVMPYVATLTEVS
jgi:PWWP domain